MRTDGPEQFDDPVLKSAVKKAYAQENAPEALRRKVAELTGIASAGESVSIPLRRPNRWYGWAAAAVLLLAIGVAISQYLGLFGSGSGAAANALPVRITDGMVAAHDACAKLPEHQLIKGVSGEDWPAIQQALKTELQRPVLAAPLGEGWKFEGAGICKVANQYRAGHLLFSRGNQTVSLFSLGPVAYDVKGDGNYELNAAGHPIAGFATKEGLYCLVGYDPSGALTLQELAGLRDKIRGKLVSFGSPPAMGVCPSQAVSLR